MTEAETRNWFAFLAVVAGVVVAGYMIKSERNAHAIDRAYASWINHNGLSDFKDFLYIEG